MIEVNPFSGAAAYTSGEFGFLVVLNEFRGNYSDHGGSGSGSDSDSDGGSDGRSDSSNCKKHTINNAVLSFFCVLFSIVYIPV